MGIYVIFILCLVIIFEIGIILSLTSLSLGFCDNIRDSFMEISMMIVYHWLCDMDYPWLMIILFSFLGVWVGLWVYNPCDVVVYMICIIGCDFICVFWILMYVIILSLFYDHCFVIWCKGFFYYPWSMMSSDLNCDCWWEM